MLVVHHGRGCGGEARRGKEGKEAVFAPNLRRPLERGSRREKGGKEKEEERGSIGINVARVKGEEEKVLYGRP